MKKAIVRIRGSNSQVGTGFVFGVSTEKIAYVMTALHVVELWDIPGENQFKINFTFSDKDYDSRVRWQNRDIDLAILSLAEYPSEIQALVLGESRGSEEGR
ncbi:MAG: trypsin-like peptidase domain-containing protein, partial [Fidelibacterota bacterium]